MSGKADHRPPATPVPRVNLLPQAVWLAQISQRRRRWWGGSLAVLALLAGLAWLWCGSRGAELQRLHSMSAEEQALTRREQRRSAALAARAEVLRKQQNLLDAMRAAESWSVRLAELAAIVPDGAVLKSIQVLPADTRATAKNQGGTEKDARSAEAGTELRVDGYAADHAVLATLLRSLEERGTYREVRLVRSAAAGTDGSACLDFCIVCRR